MKKLFNWIVGSFFRTFGRILCYIAIGFLMFLLFSGKLNLKAAELTSWTTNQSLIIYDKAGTESETSWKNNPFSWNTEFNSYPIKAIVYRLNYSGGLHDDSNYTFTWGYQMQPDSAGVKDFYIGHNASNKENVTCSEWYLNSNNYRLKDCSFTPKENYSSSEYLYIRVNFYQDYITQIRPYVYGFYIREGVNSVITDQTDKIRQEQQKTNEKLDDTNEKLDNIDDALTDDDVSGATDSASGFFDSFESDDFGLSSIVTAPLRGINAMLNDTCVAPSATYKGQTFSLPCGSMLWERPGGSDLRSFINVMYGGFLVYFVIRKIFIDVENLKNPDNDKVEVEKL